MNELTKNILLKPFDFIYKISPELDLKILFRLKQGYSLNLSSPQTYNEKIQWLKLHDHNPLMPKCCDKFLVREFVKEQGCEEILNHLIWEGSSPEDIPFEALPERFVIKITHGSTFNIICMDKQSLNKEETISKCKKWLKSKFLPCYGEWFYGIVPPRVIVEDYIESGDGEDLKDYKIFCFNGKAYYIRIDSDRFTDHKSDFYDVNWNYIKSKHTGYRCAGDNFAKPICLNKLLNYAENLASPFLHARVDFYIIGERIIFGEVTFTNGAGFDKFSSYDFDLEMGQKLKLPIL